MGKIMGRKTSFLVVLVHWYLSLATILCMFTYCHGNPNVLCRKRERESLLTFKESIIDHSNQLSSWIGQECCMWKEIGCDNITGHVIQLNLRSPYNPLIANEDFEWQRLGGLVSDSLLGLKHLHYLDLSFNCFEDTNIPSFFGHLQNLRYLNLSYACFVGGSPHQLANLSNLHYLDINGLSLQIDNLEWLSHLSLLEFLDMSYLNLSKVSNWLQVMSMLPSLSELHLSSCELDKYDPIPYVNFSSLTVLDLSINWLPNSTFDWFSSTMLNLLCNISTLEILDLAYNNIQAVLPDAIESLSRLRYLVLPWNGFEGKLPRSLGNLCNLQFLDLSYNKLQGDVYGLLGNSSACKVGNLKHLYLNWNKLSGTLPDQLGKHKKLSALVLNGNMFSGLIPVSIGKLSSLRSLDVSDNKLNGTIPVSLGNLSNLEELLISNNFLEGFVYDVHFFNLTKLKTLDASSNFLTWNVSSNWVPPFQLQVLRMGSWSLGPQFPTWLQSQKNLRELDLSYTGISDVIPSWFWSRCFQTYWLDLSQNQIRGNIPSLSFGTSIILASNNFSGPLPLISSGILNLDLANNSFHGSLSPLICEHKDLSKNLLFGELHGCWTNNSQLEMLNLGSNKLTGNIPSSFGSLSALKSLFLYKNNLSGDLPLSLQNCKDLMIVDLSENHLSGNLSILLGHSNLIALVLRSNRLHGNISQELCYLNLLKIMDLAHNKFTGSIMPCFGNLRAMVRPNPSILTDFIAQNSLSLVTKGIEHEYSRGNTLSLVTSIDLSSNDLIGEIPEELTNLYGLRYLNLSNNQLHGKIPEKINAMELLESLDLSMNNLTCVIPQSMANLTFLGYLDLSYNNFSGRIPSSTQLQSFSALNFIGNHDLCGPPLTPSCVGDDTPIELTPNVDDEGIQGSDWIDMKWFYMGMPFGFVVGFWGVFGPLAFNKAWRSTFFKFFDGIKYEPFGDV